MSTIDRDLDALLAHAVRGDLRLIEVFFERGEATTEKGGNFTPRFVVLDQTASVGDTLLGELDRPTHRLAATHGGLHACACLVRNRALHVEHRSGSTEMCELRRLRDSFLRFVIQEPYGCW